ncbi:putative dienelactone hydrolase [Krasilnikovia cinnamomea]|uniref:Putative dienelactone hydrolase n=1 Tax=Krasilnikovia cinnamomea TaxID=349313 RepID=A0A4Q7ZRU1_9ACTN|nr:alpha/beta hydrolase [Krasilnikovia cinnamomea]RZU53564.1 putative dienelactone hydrolase [Krasilnikovia cinnamomea]
MFRTALACLALTATLLAAPTPATALTAADATDLARRAATLDETAPDDTSAPGAFAVGTTDVTVTVARRSFGAKVWYPAASAGANRPVADGAFGVVAFGHGFLQSVGRYASTLSHLASWGFVVAAPTSQGGLAPDHSAFADDLNATLTWFVDQGTTPGSRFANHVDPAALALSGHSMGGGASVLAAVRNRNVRTVANLAAAETNPSAKTAAANLPMAAMLVAGDHDTIAPPADNQIPIYQAKPAPKQLRTILGGCHCGFMDSGTLFCDSGSIDRAVQLKLTRRLLTDWFLYTLSGDTSRYDAVWGIQAQNDPQIRFEGAR